MTIAIEWVEVANDPSEWESAGFLVESSAVHVAGVEIRLIGEQEIRGIRRWGLSGVGVDDLDGLPTVSAESTGRAISVDNPNGATALDHIVIGSPNRERTKKAFAAIGLEPRRETTHELYGRPMVQTFYKLGDVVVEVISRPEAEGDGPSVFWGLAFTVADLDQTCEFFGDAVSTPKDAVQPGRQIASLRHEKVGISVPVAFLSPPPARTT